jgi:hypothetical protein
VLPCGACGGRPADDGADPCPGCGGSGETEISGCPLALVTPDVAQAMDLIDWFEAHGLPPVAGGSTDQTECWMTALTVVTNERARILASKQKGRGRG